jgi:hypothetical protein
MADHTLHELLTAALDANGGVYNKTTAEHFRAALFAADNAKELLWELFANNRDNIIGHHFRQVARQTRKVHVPRGEKVSTDLPLGSHPQNSADSPPRRTATAPDLNARAEVARQSLEDMAKTKCAVGACKKHSATPQADGWTWVEFDWTAAAELPATKTGWWCPKCFSAVHQIIAEHGLPPFAARVQ